MTDKPDFEALRAARNARVKANVEKICAEQGWDVSEVQRSHNDNACYCACPDGPCEHTFEGWHEFEDGSGGTTICSRCGASAMGHDMRVMP